MIYNRDKKFIVFQPWKTASSTLYLRLAPFNQSPYSRFYYFNDHLKRIVHQHITVADLKGLPEYQPEFRVAAFVRNPYDRVYSGFIQIQRDLKEQPSLPFPEPWIRDHVLKQLAGNQQKLVQAGYDFDRWVELLTPADVYQTGNSSLPIYPAHYWTHDNGQAFARFVGKVESFEKDFSALLQWLDISGGYSLENDNVTALPTEDNPSGYRYAERMKASSIGKINQLFAKDFELFGYPML